VSLLQRLLLLPLLSPLLAVLLLGALNPRPWVALRLLTWTSPAWPLGAWIGGAAAAGAALSAAGAGLALRAGSPGISERRQVRRSPIGEADNSRDDDAAAPPRNAWSGWAGPTRAAADPPPTVSVPFRVIRKGSGRPGPSADGQTIPTRPQAPTAASSTATAVGDGWEAPTSEDW